MAAFTAARRGSPFGNLRPGGRASFVQGSGPSARPIARRPGMGVGGKAWPPRNNTNRENFGKDDEADEPEEKKNDNENQGKTDQEEAKRRRESGESGGPEAKGARRGDEGKTGTG